MKNFIFFIPLITILILCCNNKNESENEPNSFDLTSIKNSTFYISVKDRTEYKLQDGKFENRPLGISITLNEFVAFGDLNSDNINDAIAVLNVQSGYNSSIYNLAVLINENNKPVHKASLFLGERLQLKRIFIKDKLIYIDMLIHQKNDALCCPSKQVTRVYEFNGKEIISKAKDIKFFNCIAEDKSFKLQILQDGIIYQTDELVEKYPLSFPEIIDDEYVYNIQDKYDNNIQIKITNFKCLNTLNSSLFYVFELSKNGQVYRGCAEEIRFESEVEDIKNYVNELSKKINANDTEVRKWKFGDDEIFLNIYREENQIKYIAEKTPKNTNRKVAEYYFQDDKLIFYRQNHLHINQDGLDRKQNEYSSLDLYLDKKGDILFYDKRDNNVFIALDNGEKTNIFTHLDEILSVIKSNK